MIHQKNLQGDTLREEWNNMESVLLNISKYVLIFVILFYTYLSFSINGTSKESALKRKYVAQNIFTLIFFIICSVIVVYENKTMMSFVFAVLELVYLIILILLYQIIYPNCSRLLVNNMAMLLSLGFIMVERLAPANAFKQFLIVLTGTVISFFVPSIMRKRRIFMKLKYPVVILGILLLGVTLVLGKATGGANLSFNIGGFTFQASELVKLIYVVFLAAMLSKARVFKNVIISGIIAAVHVLVLVASTDLGAALIFFIVYISMLFIGTGKLRWLVIGLLAGSTASVLAYKLFAHVRIRVAAWRDPWSIIDGKGYQITQSLFAIGTGGWFGIGLYQGLPTKIPVVVKDFVFAAIAEEFGLIFAIAVILICFSCYINMMNIATRSRDMFYKLLAAGFGTLYIFQCFLTIGGVTKFIPSTGVTLPFVSYGGSSILSSLFMFAMVQAVFILVKENEDNERKEANQKEIESVQS